MPDAVPGAVVLLSGRSFSGKSTVAEALKQSLPAEVVSFDAINADRGLSGGQGIEVEEWIHTNDIAHEQAIDLLARGVVVVVDDTSSPRFLRDAWRDLAQRSRATFVLVFIDVSAEVIRKRLLSNRSDGTRADVLDNVMEEHLDVFEPPAADERHLRFDESISADTVVDRIRTELKSKNASNLPQG